MKQAKIKTWKCSLCGKIIESIWEAQLEQNKNSHLATHDITKKEEC